jgi:hypothetical protein
LKVLWLHTYVGRTDRRGHQLINFLVNSLAGTYFLESVDASTEAHDATMLADLLEQKIVQIGKENVVQVVTDNGANYKAAGKLLMQRISILFWSPCAAHCLDLMLEDIGKLKDFKKPITQVKRVTTFIYRHGRILSAMREKMMWDGLGKTDNHSICHLLPYFEEPTQASRCLEGSICE